MSAVFSAAAMAEACRQATESLRAENTRLTEQLTRAKGLFEACERFAEACTAADDDIHSSQKWSAVHAAEDTVRKAALSFAQSREVE